MKTESLLRTLSGISWVIVAAGCGGGGSDIASVAAGTGPVFPTGTYAGTYNCAATSGSNEVFSAVLTTPTGSFSSCSGNVDSGAVSFTCSGSISSLGAFVVNKVDVNGVSSTNTGTVTDATVVGTYTVPAKGITGNFGCSRS